ncbi:MAG: hypothetical protein LBF97_05130, partial [Elusimicrobiota bacterium]|nr:hypothetical protein [Elusimicrobiota bacterium]
IAILLGYDCSHRPEEMTNQLRCNIDIDTEIGVIAENKKDEKLGITAWMPKKVQMKSKNDNKFLRGF